MNSIRNIAIIAHVDHGKTTLVDWMLKQTHTFRANEKEMTETTILDKNELEREKGITILSKNTAVYYQDIKHQRDPGYVGTKINIIDTPGHADFSGEVERVINMADGALLIIDAAEGPLPQTQFVLEKALERNLRIIVVINKIDRKDARPQEVLTEAENLFLHLAKESHHLEHEVIYAVGRDGKAWKNYPANFNEKADLDPLFDEIISYIPAPLDNPNAPFKMLVSTLDFDSYKGTYAIGKVSQGTIKPNQNIAVYSHLNLIAKGKIREVFTSQGLNRINTDISQTGDIIAVTGLEEISIGQTLTDPSLTEGFPNIILGEPTLKITVSPNSSPLSGGEAKFSTARQLEQRLNKEIKTNIGLKIEKSAIGSGFDISGRGELHLSILLETLRREGYEMQVGRPKVIFKKVDGNLHEPFEEVTIEVDQEHVGIIVEEIGKRLGEIIDVKSTDKNTSKYIFIVSTRNLLGLRGLLMTKTRGKAYFTARNIGYKQAIADIPGSRNGALIAFESGVSTAYALENVQLRGTALIGPGEQIYTGMIIGINSRAEDMEISVTKSKKLTNMHSENSDMAIKLDPPLRLTLEQCLDFLAEDELLEITPLSLRLRKAHLSKIDRKRQDRKEYNTSQLASK